MQPPACAAPHLLTAWTTETTLEIEDYGRCLGQYHAPDATPIIEGPPDDGTMPAWAVKIYTELARLNAVLPKHTDWAERNIKDHEIRLRVLEASYVTRAEHAKLAEQIDQVEAENDKNSWLPRISWLVLTAVVTALITLYIKK